MTEEPGVSPWLPKGESLWDQDDHKETRLCPVPPGPNPGVHQAPRCFPPSSPGPATTPHTCQRIELALGPASSPRLKHPQGNRGSVCGGREARPRLATTSSPGTHLTEAGPGHLGREGRPLHSTPPSLAPAPLDAPGGSTERNTAHGSAGSLRSQPTHRCLPRSGSISGIGVTGVETAGRAGSGTQ